MYGKNLEGWEADPFVKSWFTYKHSWVVDARVQQKSVKSFCENQLAVWNLQ